MRKINLDNWKSFRIGDLFDCEISKSIDKTYLNFTETGSYEFIGRTNANNGIQGYLDKLSFEPNPKNVFSVTQIGEKICQFREREWYGSQNLFILYPKYDYLIEIPLFINTIITKKLKLVYGNEYNSYPTIKSLPNLEIKLPIDLKGNINIEYIKEYIENLKLKTSNYINKISNTKNEAKHIDTNNWKPYKIIDLFDVKNTHSILKSWINEDTGDDPYVTASKENNGVYSYVKYDTTQIEEGNSILIGGKTLVITYQKKDFYSNDSHNLALYLKEKQYRNKYIQLFLVSALKNSLRDLYSWGDSISGKAIKKDYVYLPSDENGAPDFGYMEKYMLNIENVSKKRIEDLYMI